MLRSWLAFLLLTLSPARAQQPNPPPVRTSVTVMGPMEADTPAHVTERAQDWLRDTPGGNLDDRLRAVPGFTLFQRTSSLVALPAAQGVSLRGLGSTGASRALVLWDGWPVNDPFGGWIYWTRLIPLEFERVEVSRGASTSAFGGGAMAGTLVFVSRAPQKRRLTAAYEGGNRNTHDVTAGWSDAWSRWSLSGLVRADTSGGYYVLRSEDRGPVDRPASASFVTGDLHADYRIGLGGLFLKADLLAEERRNGTAAERNSTGLGEISGRYQGETAGDTVSLGGYYLREAFHGVFTAVAPDRRTEQLDFTQRAPSEGVGGSALWQRSRGTWHALAGTEWSRVAGWSTDVLYPTGKRVGGGSLTGGGVFTQGDLTAGPLRLFAGMRENKTGRGASFLSPSAGLVLGRGRLRLRGATYRAFRAPTLNELYREFRTGSVVTQANAELRPETLFGIEAGLDWTGERAGLRVTLYRNSLSDPILDTTLAVAAAGIVRQRTNAGPARARGLEADFFKRSGKWRLEMHYLYADSILANRLRMPEAPRSQGSAQALWTRRRTVFGLGLRAWGAQFDDDLNHYLLPGYATVQMYARQGLAKSLALKISFDNLLDRSYATAAMGPIFSTGAPRLWRIGLAWDGRVK